MRELTESQVQEMQRAVRAVIARYRRRSSFDEREAEQVALYECAVSLLTNYDTSTGTSIGAYCSTIAVRAIKNAMLDASSIVSHKHRRDALKSFKMEAVFDDTLTTDATPERECEHAQFRAFVRDRVAAVVGQSAPFAFAVIGGEWKPGDVARAHGVEVERVWELRASLVRMLSGDRRLKELWRQQ